MKQDKPIPLYTLEQALRLARSLRAGIEREDKNSRLFQVFAELAADYLEALIAFLIWKTRGQWFRPSDPGT